jgi:hypothetical protein
METIENAVEQIEFMFFDVESKFSKEKYQKWLVPMIIL